MTGEPNFRPRRNGPSGTPAGPGKVGENEPNTEAENTEPETRNAPRREEADAVRFDHAEPDPDLQAG